MNYLLYVNGVLENSTNSMIQAIQWYDKLRVIMPRADVCILENYYGRAIRNSWDE